MESTTPAKTLVERSDELLKLFLGVGVRPGDFGIDGEQLAREAVRWCRALEDEAKQATPRPEPEKKPRQAVQRGVPPQPEELNLDQEPGFYDE